MLKFCSQKKASSESGTGLERNENLAAPYSTKKRQRNRCLQSKVFQISNRHFILFYF